VDNVKFFKCDITSKEDVDRSASDIRVSLGSPSILINNAGIAHAHTILEATPEYLTKLFNVNLISQFYTIQAFLPDMIKAKKGHVISTASIASFVTCAGLVDYAASKAAVMALNEGLQQELKHRYNAPEIKTSIIHPIYVKTPLVSSYAKSLERSKAVQIEPEMVANAILKQVDSGRSGRIVLPSWMGLLANARSWADWVQQMIGDSSKDDVKEEVAVAKTG
jgi:all-trans-retinol dehydrogenase (NAD+)